MSRKELMFKLLDSLEDEFERILVQGYDQDSPFYEYLADIRTMVGKEDE